MSSIVVEECPVDELTDEGSEDDAVQLFELLSLSMWRRLEPLPADT